MSISNLQGVISKRSDLNLNVNSLSLNVIPLSANATLTANNSGNIFSLTSAAANYQINLPAPASCLGAHFYFVVAATAGTNQVEISSTGANMYGFKDLNGTWTDENTAKTNIFIGNSTGPVASTVGDRVEIYSDGVNYYWVGYGHVALSIRTS